MRLLRELNTGKVTIKSDDTDISVLKELKDFLILFFHKELLFELLTNSLNRNNIPIFKANQLHIVFHQRTNLIYFIFFKNDEESKIEIVTNSKYFEDVLTSLMIEIEQNEGDTLFGFSTDLVKMYSRTEIKDIISECLMFNKNE